jgi:hypothetical protein
MIFQEEILVTFAGLLYLIQTIKQGQSLGKNKLFI